MKSQFDAVMLYVPHLADNIYHMLLFTNKVKEIMKRIVIYHINSSDFALRCI